MKKRIAFILTALIVSLAANAQFEQGKGYLGASLTHLELSYTGISKGYFGIGAKAGYFLADDWMVAGQLDYQKKKDTPYELTLGAGLRYYIVQNGLYMGASAAFKHKKEYNDFMPSIQIGYAFFIGRTVTFEPELFYEHSFKDHSNYSNAGIRVGVGVYLFKDQYKIKK
jgi:hypothetical protein